MPPKIMQNMADNSWVIVTNATEIRKGVSRAEQRHQYPIPDKVLEQIAYDWICRQELKGYENNGCTMVVTCPDNSEVKVTVKPLRGDEQ